MNDPIIKYFIKYFLGIEFDCNGKKNEINLSQKKYFSYKMNDCKSVATNTSGFFKKIS